MSYHAAIAKVIYSNDLTGASGGPTSWLTTASPFNGSSTLVESSLSLTTLGSSFAIAVWAKVTAGQSSTSLGNSIFGTTTEGLGLRWGHNNASYRGVGYTRTAASAFPTPTGGPASPAANVWKHFAVVYASSVLTTYLDGVSVGSLSNAIAYQLGDTVRFGSYGAPNATPGWFNGDMAQALILNGGTAADIAQLFAGPEPINTVAPAASFAAGLLSSTTGTWDSYSNGTPTYAHQWQSFSGSWSNIGGATSSTYTPPSDGLYRCNVTASNNGGAGTATASNSVLVSLGSNIVYPPPIAFARPIWRHTWRP